MIDSRTITDNQSRLGCNLYHKMRYHYGGTFWTKRCEIPWHILDSRSRFRVYAFAIHERATSFGWETLYRQQFVTTTNTEKQFYWCILTFSGAEPLLNVHQRNGGDETVHSPIGQSQDILFRFAVATKFTLNESHFSALSVYD